MSDSGIATLDAWIERLKKLGGANVVVRVAQVAAPLVDEAIKKTVKAGADPLGGAWRPKKGGGAPLPHAAVHITTRPLGNLVAVTLKGVDVFHHKGLGHNPRRQILPDGASIPDAINKALHLAAKKVFDEIMGGG